MDKWLIKTSKPEGDGSGEGASVKRAAAESKEIDEDDLPDTKKRKRFTYKFIPAWLELQEFKYWLKKATKVKNGNEYAHCTVCNEDMLAHKADIKRHGLTSKHIANFNQISSNSKIDTIFQRNQPLQISTRRAELKLSGLLASNDLPFLLMDTLAPLCKDIFNDSEIAKNICIKRTKATALTQHALGEVVSDEFFKKLQEPGSFFSIIIDETTDVGSVKQCAFTVIYFCTQKKKVMTDFFDIAEVSVCTAKELYNCLKDKILSKNIPFDNLIGFSADTCNVMFGEHNSVVSLLKEDLPQIVHIKCSCHMIHLAASKACLALPRSVEDLLRNLGSHFSRSYKKQERFKEFQIFFHVDIHKILSPAATRWLSLQACVNRVLEQYAPLHAYLQELVFSDPSRTYDDMLSAMNNKFTKIYLQFMSYNLGLLNDFNTLFQSETSLLHRVKSETERLLRTLCSNYMDFQYVKNANILSIDHKDPRYLIAYDKIYLGVPATASLLELKNSAAPQELDVFFKSCLNFYIDLITDIKKRFTFKEPIFEIITLVDPVEAQSYKVRSLLHVLNMFSVLEKYVNAQEIDNEWREHALLDHSEINVNKAETAEDYWRNIFSLKNQAGLPKFKNLQVLINFLLILPFSNASVERLFSNIKNIKTENRNRLGRDSLAALLYTKQAIKNAGGILQFEPNQKMLKADVWNK